MSYRYQRYLALRAPADTLREFFSDVRHLNSQTPPHFQLQLRQGEAGIPLQVGQLFVYRFRIFGLPFPWTTEIREVAAHRFVDVQQRGPFRKFVHQHTFVPLPDGALMLDQIKYELPFGCLNAAVNALFVRPLLDSIFEFRARKAVERFGQATMQAPAPARSSHS